MPPSPDSAPSCTTGCDAAPMVDAVVVDPPRGWMAQRIPFPATSALWVSGDDDIFVGGDGLIAHTTGDGTWTTEETALLLSEYVTAIWGTGPGGDVYATGSEGSIVLTHSTGGANRIVTNSTFTHTGVWGSGANDVYAVGFDGQFRGLVMHLGANGMFEQQTMPQGARELQAVWGSGPSDVYAVGSGGQIWHSTGDGTWSQRTSGVTVTLSAVWGSGPTNVFAAGRNGTIVHYDGIAWRLESSGDTSEVRSLWGSGPNDVYLIDRRGLMHSTGDGTWTLARGQIDPSSGSPSWRIVYGTSPTRIYAVGTAGTPSFLVTGP